LGLEEVLPKATIEQVLQEEGGKWKSILYTPWVDCPVCAVFLC